MLVHRQSVAERDIVAVSDAIGQSDGRVPEPVGCGGRPGDMSRPLHALLPALLAALIAGACGTSTASPANASIQAPTPLAAEPSPSASASASAVSSGVDLGSVPTACIGLGADDCRRVVAEVGEIVPVGTAARYVQVGPFGCPDGQPCATSLADRQQGDITIEAGAGALSYHVTAADDAQLTFAQQDAFGVLVGPSSQPPVSAGARPYALGHCGLWSGIDVAGSWWDPVGPIDGDHPDAINAAEGTLNLLDPERAMFTSKGGLTVQLVRRDGEKYLPLCQ